MPLCHIFTNIPEKDLKDGIEERIATGMADILNKPLERVIVVVIPGVRIYRMESADPACSLTINSIGVFDKERNPGYTISIKDMIMKELGLTAERITIMYNDLDKDMIG